VAWLPPELELGEEPELKPLEPELADEPELAELEPEEREPVELEPEPEPELEPEPEPDEAEPDEPEPELAEDEPVEDEPEPVEEDVLVLCVDPGRTRASAPAVTTLATVTAVVADRTLSRPRSLAATARRIPSRCALLMYLILRPRTRESLHGPSRLPLS
jgi:outer membrane biosynthesis protein TonB